MFPKRIEGDVARSRVVSSSRAHPGPSPAKPRAAPNSPTTADTASLGEYGERRSGRVCLFNVQGTTWVKRELVFVGDSCGCLPLKVLRIAASGRTRSLGRKGRLAARGRRGAASEGGQIRSGHDDRGFTSVDSAPGALNAEDGSDRVGRPWLHFRVFRLHRGVLPVCVSIDRRARWSLRLGNKGTASSTGECDGIEA